MEALIIGGGGYIGSTAAKALIANGHEVSGVARSEAAAEGLRALGVTPAPGDVARPDGLAEIARGYDGVIFTPPVGLDEEGRRSPDCSPRSRRSEATSRTRAFAQETPLGNIGEVGLSDRRICGFSISSPSASRSAPKAGSDPQDGG